MPLCKNCKHVTLDEEELICNRPIGINRVSGGYIPLGKRCFWEREKWHLSSIFAQECGVNGRYFEEKETTK